MAELKNLVDEYEPDDLEAMETDQVLEKFKESSLYLAKILATQMHGNEELFYFHNKRLDQAYEIIKARHVDLSPYFPSKKKWKKEGQRDKDNATLGIVAGILLIVAGFMMREHDTTTDFIGFPFGAGGMLLLAGLYSYYPSKYDKQFKSHYYVKDKKTLAK